MTRPYSTIREAGKVRITLFDGAKGNEPQTTIGYESIAELARHFRKRVQVVERKARAPLYTRGLAIGGREREDVSGPYLVILDVDHSGVSLEECSKRLRQLGVAHVGHTTWSHDPDSPLDDHSYRVVLDLVAEDWVTVRSLTRDVAAHLAIDLDPVSEHQLCFYVPSTDAGREVEFASWGGPSTWEPDPATWDDLGPAPVELESQEAVERVAVDAEDFDLGKLRSALDAIPNETYQQWIRTGQCLHGSGLENARALWDEWSAGQDYVDAGKENPDEKWASFGKAGLTVRTIYWDARKHGWTWRTPAAEQFDAWVDEDEGLSKRDHLERLSERYAYVALGQGTVWDKEQGRFLTRNAFMGLYQHPEFFTGKSLKGEPIMESLGHAWWDWEERPTYAGVDFAPPGAPPLRPDILNSWQGWGAEPAEHSPEELRGQCDRFLDHVHEVLCKGDEQLYAWILAWMAHLVQRPAEKVGTCIVMRGDEGTGKGFFGDTLIALVGKAAVKVGESGGLTRNFNAKLSGKLLIFGDEVTWGGRRADAGVLKGLITERTITIEPKGIDSYEERSYSRTLISSNEDWVVPAGPTARRYLCLDVSSIHKEDRPYFARIQAQLDDGGLEALHGYLAGLDLAELPDPRVIRKTAALLDQKLRALDPIDRWVQDALLEGEVSPCFAWKGYPEKFATTELTSLAQAKTRKNEIEPRQHEVTLRLKKIFVGMKGNLRMPACPDEEGNDFRPRALELPGLTDARAAFDKYMGQPLDWEN